MSRIKNLRELIESQIVGKVEGAAVNGHSTERLPTVTNIRLPHVDSQAVMTMIRNKISISSGSACSSADPSPSHVLLAMGLSVMQAKSSIRISLGVPVTIEEAQIASDLLVHAIDEYRTQSPVWQMFKAGIELPEA
jgi:cysteine desulfurase